MTRSETGNAPGYVHDLYPYPDLGVYPSLDPCLWWRNGDSRDDGLYKTRGNDHHENETSSVFWIEIVSVSGIETLNVSGIETSSGRGHPIYPSPSLLYRVTYLCLCLVPGPDLFCDP